MNPFRTPFSDCQGHILLTLFNPQPQHTSLITMNCEACHHIAWWLKFFPSWNGHAIIPDPHWTRSPDLELVTDASGSLSYGIF